MAEYDIHDVNDLNGPYFYSQLEHEWTSNRVLGRGIILDEEVQACNIVLGDHLEAFAQTDNPTMLDLNMALARQVKYYAASRGGTISDQLADIRETIDAIEPRFRTELDALIEDNISPFIRDQYEAWEQKRPSLTRRLIGRIAGRRQIETDTGAPRWTQWMVKGASDKELINYFQWHNAQIEAMQADPELQAIVNEEKAIFKRGIETGIDKAYLPLSALDAMNGADEARVLFTDHYDSSRLGGVGGYVGKTAINVWNWEWSGEEAAFIAEPTDSGAPIEDNIRHATVHELNHLLLGSFGPTWVNEALTEHINQAMHTGLWHILAQSERADDGGYGAYRDLLDCVLEPDTDAVSARTMSWRDARFIPLSNLTYAYASGDKGREGRDAVDRVYSDIEEVYGRPEILTLIEVRLKAIEQTLPHYGEVAYHFHNQSEAARIMLEEWKNPETQRALIGMSPGFVPKRATISL
jgi:hypothetical protein